MRATRARSNPVTTNEKIAIGVGLALGVGGLIFLFTRPSAAAATGGGGGAKQPGLVDKNGNPISVDNNPPPPPPPVVPPPPPPPNGGVAISTHPLLDAAVAAIKNYDTLLQTSYTDQQKQTAFDAAYNAMTAALRGGELGSTGQVFTDAQNALTLADGIRDNWSNAVAALTAANNSNDVQAIAAAEANLTTVQAMLDNARADAYSKMLIAVQAQTIPPDAYQKAFSDLFNLGL